MNNLHLSVIEAFLCNGWSHRKIQMEIMGIDAPDRGGGFEAMKVLHEYGIKGCHKNILRGMTIDRNIFDTVSNIDEYLNQLNQ